MEEGEDFSTTDTTNQEFLISEQTATRALPVVDVVEC